MQEAQTDLATAEANLESANATKTSSEKRIRVLTGKRDTNRGDLEDMEAELEKVMKNKPKPVRTYTYTRKLSERQKCSERAAYISP